VTSEQLAALSELFYLHRASPDFERKPRAAVREALDAAGLIGPFWELPS